jgi:cytochrome c oxidase cbb3-type subunit 3
MTSFWSAWIIVLTTITIVGITWILFANRKREEQPTDQTTGHAADGIEEYDNPLPAWWFYMFVLTIVWGIGYLILYPGMGNFPGLLGWTQLNQYHASVAEADERFRAMRDRYLALPVEEIASDPAVRKMGMRMFANNCAQCHGADARGSYGFPNLADGDWLYGGHPTQIKVSIADGRQAAMPAWGGVIGEDGITNVTAYILSLNGRDANAAQAAAGEKVFQTYCVACHGADASGNIAFGAPNLKNGIWLYGGSAEQIAHTLRVGRNGVMPAQKDVLSEDKLHILTAYVYGLSQEQEPQQ